jgi:Fungal domain of unknown function (DUF1746)
MNNADEPLPATADDIDADAGAPSPAHESPSTQKRKKRVELLADLLESLDALIYIELSVLYYLDCAFGLLILRTLVQLFLLKARPGPSTSPPTRSALGAVLGSNILCIILHQVNARPEAGEATRFYMHGSILIDFVGQPGPTSKWSLFAMDVLVFVLQFVMLGLGIEKRKVQNSEKDVLGTTQDLEAEEAGITRDEGLRDEVHESDEGIEMQELLAERTLEGKGEQGGPHIHPLDEFYTGSTVLARLNVIETISRDVVSSASGSEGVERSGTGGGVYLPGVFGIRWRSLR